MEKPIIPPVDKALLREEFARATELPEASHGAIKLYCIDVGFPAILREISRLREIAFRSGGGQSHPPTYRNRTKIDRNERRNAQGIQGKS